MFQGAFNKAMGMGTAGIMGASKLFGVPDVQKQLEMQKQITKIYQYELGKLIYKRDMNLPAGRKKWEKVKARIDKEMARKAKKEKERSLG